MARLVSWLFVPGANERFLAKLPSIRPDVAVLDLEDGLDPKELLPARERVADALREVRYPAVRLALRTHPVTTPGFLKDAATLGPALAVLILPKVSSNIEVLEAASVLGDLGLSNVKIVPLIESAEGVRNAFKILSAHPAVEGVALGTEDLAADLGLPFHVNDDPFIEEGRKELLNAARSQLIITATAAGIPWRIDAPALTLGDFALVERAAMKARARGFTGMFAVHPAQVAALARGFLPTPSEIDRARDVLAASDREGARSHQGRMVDEAVLRQARRTLEAVGE